MRVNSFSSMQKNNYQGKNKQVSFGLPPVIEKIHLSENITIPTPMRISQEAFKAEIKLKEAMKQYNKDYIKQVNEAANKTYKELSERENATSTYDAGFADHHND